MAVVVRVHGWPRSQNLATMPSENRAALNSEMVREHPRLAHP